MDWSSRSPDLIISGTVGRGGMQLEKHPGPKNSVAERVKPIVTGIHKLLISRRKSRCDAYIYLQKGTTIPYYLLFFFLLFCKRCFLPSDSNECYVRSCVCIYMRGYLVCINVCTCQISLKSAQ